MYKNRSMQHINMENTWKLIQIQKFCILEAMQRETALVESSQSCCKTIRQFDEGN